MRGDWHGLGMGIYSIRMPSEMHLGAVQYISMMHSVHLYLMANLTQAPALPLLLQGTEERKSSSIILYWTLIADNVQYNFVLDANSGQRPVFFVLDANCS